MDQPDESADRDLACREFVTLLTDYLEGALDADTTALVRAHLDDCPHCQTYLEQMRTTIDALGHVPLQTLSDRAKADIIAAFRGTRTPTS